ncbi:MAG: leucyl aminopeptidase [Acidimicrobiaceae bacterium]|nr:leucyl aminopeptidase [Acidimicrobiaceae bacterium]
MRLKPEVATDTPSDAEAVARFVYADLEPADGEPLDAVAARRRGFSGKLGEAAVSTRADGTLEVLLGLGDRQRAGRDALRRAGAVLARQASGCRVVAVPVVGLSAPPPELAARSLVEGAGMAAHRYEPPGRRTPARPGSLDDEPNDAQPTASESAGSASNGPGSSGPGRARIERLVLVANDPGVRTALRRGAERGRIIAEAVALTRDLVNTPAGDLPPVTFANRAAEIAAAEGLDVRIWDEEDARREGLGALLGVASGSAQPPRLLRLAYHPEGAGEVPTVALVGKGITFDSGGLSLKPAASMLAMKTDMSGAAAVLAVLAACRGLAIPVAVVGFCPLAENLPGPRAVKPGDVLRTRSGKTIEVLNTDAEGRLVLADALTLAVEENPDALVDLATLTGACVVALGRQVAGLFGNDDRLIEAVRRSALEAGEPVWPLPMPTAYRRMVDSEVADLNNQGVPGQAGALTAALILQEFVRTTPWVHLDIAGPARSEEDAGYFHKGGTGFGVRTLVELLEHYRPFGGTAAGSPGGTVELP